jgi:hypothetical protein
MHTRSCFILYSEYNTCAKILAVIGGRIRKQLNAHTEQALQQCCIVDLWGSITTFYSTLWIFIHICGFKCASCLIEQIKFIR